MLTGEQQQILTTLMGMLRTENMLSDARLAELEDAIQRSTMSNKMTPEELQRLFAKIANETSAPAVQVNVGAETVGEWRRKTIIFGIFILLGWSVMAAFGLSVAEIWALFISIPSLIGSAIIPPVPMSGMPMSGMPAAAAAAAPNATAAVVATIKAAVAADRTLGSTIYGIMKQLSTSIIQATIACIGSAIDAVANAVCAIINIEYGNHLAAIFELSITGALAWIGIKTASVGVDVLSGKHDATIALTPEFIDQLVEIIGDNFAVAGHDIYDANGNLVLRWDEERQLYRTDATFATIIFEAWMAAVNLRRTQNIPLINKETYEGTVKYDFSHSKKNFAAKYGRPVYTLTSLLMNPPTPLQNLKETHSASGFPAKKEQVSPRADSMHNLVGTYPDNTFNMFQYTTKDKSILAILKAKADKPHTQAVTDYAEQFHAEYNKAREKWPLVKQVFGIRLSNLDKYEGVNYTFYDLVSKSPNWSDVLSTVTSSLDYDKGLPSNPDNIPRAFEAGMALLMNPERESRELSTSSSSTIKASSANPRGKPTPKEGELTIGELTRQIGLPLKNEIAYAELEKQKDSTKQMLKQIYPSATPSLFSSVTNATSATSASGKMEVNPQTSPMFVPEFKELYNTDTNFNNIINTNPLLKQAIWNLNHDELNELLVNIIPNPDPNNRMSPDEIQKNYMKDILYFLKINEKSSQNLKAEVEGNIKNLEKKINNRAGGRRRKSRHYRKKRSTLKRRRIRRRSTRKGRKRRHTKRR